MSRGEYRQGVASGRLICIVSVYVGSVGWRRDPFIGDAVMQSRAGIVHEGRTRKGPFAQWLVIVIVPMHALGRPRCLWSAILSPSPPQDIGDWLGKAKACALPPTHNLSKSRADAHTHTPLSYDRRVVWGVMLPFQRSEKSLSIRMENIQEVMADSKIASKSSLRQAVGFRGAGEPVWICWER